MAKQIIPLQRKGLRASAFNFCVLFEKKEQKDAKYKEKKRSPVGVKRSADGVQITAEPIDTPFRLFSNHFQRSNCFN